MIGGRNVCSPIEVSPRESSPVNADGSKDAVSLTVDPSVITCIANDYGYEEVFARQVRGLGRPGDVLVGMSTSGTSKNVLAALDAANELGLTTIAIVGQGGSPTADLVLSAPSRHTARVQEIHTAALHAICDVAEQLLFG